LKRSDMTATVVNDVIILAGGCNSNQVCPSTADFCYCTSITDATHAYNPKEDSWKIVSRMPATRYRHSAAAVGDKVYLFGGRDLADNLLKTIDVYNVITDSWSTLPNQWQQATSDSVAVSVNGKIYIIGGYDANYTAVSTVWTLDVSSSTLMPTAGSIPSLITARGDACAAALDNEIFVYGGYSDNFCSPLGTLETFQISSSNWTVRAPLHEPRGDSGCGIAHGFFHAVGGEQKNNASGCTKYSIPIHDVEAYDPTTNTWTEELPIPQVGYRYAYASYQDTFYIFGGQGALDQEEYDVSGNVYSWYDPILSAGLHFGHNLNHVLYLACIVVAVWIGNLIV